MNSIQHDANKTNLLKEIQSLHDNTTGEGSGMLSTAICKEDDDHSQSEFIEQTAMFEPTKPLVNDVAKVPSSLLQFQKVEVARSA